MDSFTPLLTYKVLKRSQLTMTQMLRFTPLLTYKVVLCQEKVQIKRELFS